MRIVESLEDVDPDRILDRVALLTPHPDTDPITRAELTERLRYEVGRSCGDAAGCAVPGKPRARTNEPLWRPEWPECGGSGGRR